MKIETISKYLSSNSLSQEEIEKLLKKEVGDVIGKEYAKGYLKAIRHIKLCRESRARRLDFEFGNAIDFLYDLTHDTQ